MNISASIRKITLLFVVLFIGLSGGLVYWQVVVADQVKANIYNLRHYLPDNIPVRGRIYDRNGVLLASTDQNGLRHYTDPSLAGLIGYYINPTIPATGIEAQYDDILSGRSGTTSLDNIMNQTLHRPPIGDDIYLTIDERIQQIVSKRFDEPIVVDNNVTFASDRGSIIVTDPHSGEILAILSHPSFDPNKMVQTLSAGDQSYYNAMNADKEQPLLMRPFRSLYPPGSTYKTVTLLAAVDSNSATLDDKFDKKHAIGPVRLGNETFGPDGNNISGYTTDNMYPVSTNYGFTHSDNIIFAQVGVKTGVDTWLDYNSRFSIGKELPASDAFRWSKSLVTSTVLPNRATSGTMSVAQLAENSFGQGVDLMTPMQMSLFDNGIANDGQLMQPMLLTKITDRNGVTLQGYDPQPLGSRQISSQTATTVRQAMYGVARCGSGRLAAEFQSSKWGIIGKTGTAQVSNNQTIPADSWLITQGPYDTANPTQPPLLTITGMKENAGEGANVLGPMIARIYNDIFTNIIKTQLPTAIDHTYCIQNKLSQYTN